MLVKIIQTLHNLIRLSVSLAELKCLLTVELLHIMCKKFRFRESLFSYTYEINVYFGVFQTKRLKAMVKAQKFVIFDNLLLFSFNIKNLIVIFFILVFNQTI